MSCTPPSLLTMSQPTDSHSTCNESLIGTLRYAVRRTPHAPFLEVAPTRSLSYHTFHTISSYLLPARLLNIAPTLRPGTRVGIISPNTPLYPLALWSLWTLQAVVVPISIFADSSLWSTMAEMTEMDLLLVSKTMHSRAASVFHACNPSIDLLPLESLVPGLEQSDAEDKNDAIIDLCQHWVAEGAVNDASSLDVHPSTPCCILFTSSAVDASTLKPVMYTHDMVVDSGRRSIEVFGGDSYTGMPKRHLGWLPLSHAFELTNSLLGIVLRTAGCYIFHDPSKSSPDLDARAPLSLTLRLSLEFHRKIQTFCSVPAVLTSIQQDWSQAQWQILRSLDTLCVAGAPCPDNLLEWARSECIPLTDMVGATEAGGGICARDIRGDGLTMMSGLMGVLEKDEIEDRYGELLVIGKHLPTGYHNRSSEAFSYDHASGTTIYRTGDLFSCSVVSGGHVIRRGDTLPSYDSGARMTGLRYYARIDDIIVLNSGLKVDALAIEKSINSLDFVTQSAVVINRKRNGLNILVEPKTSMLTVLSRLIDAIIDINRSLSFERRISPEDIIIVDSLPLSTKSTLHRRKVYEILKSSDGSWPMSRRLLIRSNRPNASDKANPIEIEHIRSKVEEIVAKVSKVPLTDVAEPGCQLSDLSINSLAIVALMRAIHVEFGTSLKQIDVYRARTIADICQLILHSGYASLQTALPSKDRTVVTESGRQSGHGIAITGVACRFPADIRNMDTYWSALVSPDAYSDRLPRQAPPSRWDPVETGADLPMGFLDDEDLNHSLSLAAFFGVKPSEWKAMSPNSRLVMQLGYEALQDAGIGTTYLNGRPWGVFTSVNDSGWREFRLKQQGLSEYSSLWSSASDEVGGSRLAFFLNLQGPALEIKTACSGSAVALHYACTSITNGDCEGAVVISSTTQFSPAAARYLRTAGIGSPSGKCSPFSSDADGFLPSEGAVALVVQRKDDALCVPHAVIRASAIAQDGRGTSFSAPNPDAQAGLLKMTLKKADCGPDDISFFETHGTGTTVGDAIEISAINEVYGSYRTKPLILGAVKAVVGHTQECSGLTAILKAILCFRKNAIPPQPHFGLPGPEIDLFQSKIVIPRYVQAFPPESGGRLVAVSSFGLSGTLSHIILQDVSANAHDLPHNADGINVFLLSARSTTEFRKLLYRFSEWCMSYDVHHASLRAVCRTTQVGRDHFRYRQGWVVKDWRQLHDVLKAALHAELPLRAPSSPTICLWFDLPHSMAAMPLLKTAAFEQDMQHYHQLGMTGDLDFFARQLAMARSLTRLGCHVAAVGGEGPGEYVAAAFAGIIDIPTLVVILRLLISATRHQSVWMVSMDHHALDEQLLTFSPHELRLRGRRDDQTSYLIGSLESMTEIKRRACSLTFRPASYLLSDNDVDLSTVHVTAHAACLPVVSGHLSEVLGDTHVQNVSYWKGIMRNTVDGGCTRRVLRKLGSIGVVLSTQGSDAAGEWTSFAEGIDECLVSLYNVGCPLDWTNLDSTEELVHMPTYCWSNDSQ